MSSGVGPIIGGLLDVYLIPTSVDAANQPVLFARTRGAPDQEMWSANAWAALVATLGLGDVACASTKAAVRAFVFGVAESIGVARAA